MIKKGTAKKTKQPKPRKSWTEKMLVNAEPTVKTIEKAFADMPAGSRMLIPNPVLLDRYIRQIPEGCSTDVKQMRNDLAIEHRADHTCPVTSGIFLRIVAEAAYEQYQRKGKPLELITPFWRAFDENSPTAKKLSFGVDFLRKQRKKEGIVRKKM